MNLIESLKADIRIAEDRVDEYERKLDAAMMDLEALKERLAELQQEPTDGR